MSGHEQHKTSNQVIPILGYGFAALSFYLFVYIFFFVTPDADNNAVREQAIYWFLIAIAAALLPHIKQIRYKDLEVLFQQRIQEVSEKLEKKTVDVERRAEITEGVSASMARQALDKLREDQQLFFQQVKDDVKAANETTENALNMLRLLAVLFPDDLHFKNLEGYFEKNRSIVMERLGRPEEVDAALGKAADSFRAVVAKDPRNASAWNGLGSVALMRRQPEEALSFIDKALEIEPNYDAAKHDRELAQMMVRKQRRN